MTARTSSPLNKDGTGRGKKVVTKSVTKKRGASADRTAVIANNRASYLDTSSIPIAELGDHIDPNKPLTEKAKLFVKYWAEGNSVAGASAMAGYGDGATYAYRLTRYPQVIELYNTEKALYEQAAQMTRKKVMDMHMEAYDMAKLMSEPSSMVAAAREIGKMCGYYEPVKVNLTLSGAATVAQQNMGKLTDAELLDIVAKGGALAIEHAVRGTEDEEQE